MYDEIKKNLNKELEAVNFLIGFVDLLEEFELEKMQKELVGRLINEMNKILVVLHEKEKIKCDGMRSQHEK